MQTSWRDEVQRFYDIDSNIPTHQRLAIIQNYATENPAAVPKLLHSIVQVDLATAELFIKTHTDSVDLTTWENVIEQTQDLELLMEGLKLFPHKDDLLVPRITTAMVDSGLFNEARRFISQALESASTIAAFSSIYRTAVEFYEHLLQVVFSTSSTASEKPLFHHSASLRSEVGAGKLLAEFQNVIKKRPLQLAAVCTRQFPNSVKMWIQRAETYGERPYLAASILETAIESINPYAPRPAVDCVMNDRDTSGQSPNLHGGSSWELEDIYIRYAELLCKNGSSSENVLQCLESAISKPFLSNKGRLAMAIADLVGYIQPESASQALESALISYPIGSPLEPMRQRIWERLLKLLIETHQDDKLLAVFGKLCISREITMKMSMLVTDAYANGSLNQRAVFDQAVTIFPVPSSLTLWKHYLFIEGQGEFTSYARGLFHRALTEFMDHKRGYEELAILYYRAEKSWSNAGSLLLARQKLVHTLQRTVNPEIWSAYIATLGDVDSLREAYEQAINRLDSATSYKFALDFAEMEKCQGQPTRAQSITEFAAQLLARSQSPEAQPLFMAEESIQFVSALT